MHMDAVVNKNLIQVGLFCTLLKLEELQQNANGQSTVIDYTLKLVVLLIQSQG